MQIVFLQEHEVGTTQVNITHFTDIAFIFLFSSTAVTLSLR
jgi:hypothetical protein